MGAINGFTRGDSTSAIRYMMTPSVSPTANRGTKSLLISFASIKPAPCDYCENRARCASEMLACYNFAAYVHTGGSTNRNHTDMPSREYFELANSYGDQPDEDEDDMPDLPPGLADKRRAAKAKEAKKRYVTKLAELAKKEQQA